MGGRISRRLTGIQTFIKRRAEQRRAREWAKQADEWVAAERASADWFNQWADEWLEQIAASTAESAEILRRTSRASSLITPEDQ